ASCPTPVISSHSMPPTSSSGRYWISPKETYERHRLILPPAAGTSSIRPRLYLRDSALESRVAERVGMDTRAARVLADDLGYLRDARRVPAARRAGSRPQ